MRRVVFANPGYEAVEVPDRAPLSMHLTIENSPVLFGCRTGICGTCLCELVQGDVPGPDDDEQEVLEVMGSDCAHPRLACRIDLVDDIVLLADP